ncbi:MAG: GTPase Era [Oligosphaeraceae bacterium]|nr:GTPase Era [Oligosphaeraceae bacterium]
MSNKVNDIFAAPERGRTGCVALLGRPNTGKSTLLNNILGCHLAAVSDKPQTTRKRLLGIYNDEQAQIAFLDTPGVHKAKLALNEAMLKSVEQVLQEADLLLCLIDPSRAPGEEDMLCAEMLQQANKPCLLLLNKKDLTSPEEREISLNFYRQFLPEAAYMNMQATDEESCNGLLEKLKSMLPEDVFLFDREDLSDATERDIVAELLREALLEELQQEIPHSMAVKLQSWQESDKGVAISADLILERESHKAIVIGRQGSMIKKIRRAAVRKIGAFLQRRVKLTLFLKVVPNWRKQKQFLQELQLWN